jgi:large subunit ribosomal protein L24e
MKCSFCGVEFQRETGLLYVKKDGSMLYFHSGKCKKNVLKLGRKPAKFKWARAGAVIKTAGKSRVSKS